MPNKTTIPNKALKRPDKVTPLTGNLTSGLFSSEEPNVWGILKSLIFLGFFAIVILSIGSIVLNTDAKGRTHFDFLSLFRLSGTALLISGACFSAGVLSGFLFAIPKLLQNTSQLPDEIKTNQTVILHNDNLVQISDWLTKIIVGVGLTQLTNIPHFIKKVGNELSNSFSYASVGTNIAVGCILYFVIVGFLAAYIWTRIYFVKLLSQSVNELQRKLEYATQKTQEVVQQKEKLEKIADFTLAEKNRESINQSHLASDASTIEELKEKASGPTKFELDKLKEKVKDTLQKKPVIVPDDLQKKRWGGKSENNGKKIAASVSAVDSSGYYSIQISIFNTDETKLELPVAIFVHDSFEFPDNVIYVMPKKDGIAQETLFAYEAFTIGALFADGTELELDLNEQPGYPQGFYWKKESQ